MQEIELLQQLLKLDKPWMVASFEIDPPSNRLDIYVRYAPRKSFLGLIKKEMKDDTRTYRHLPVWGMRTYLHVPVDASASAEKTWAPAGSNCTIDMENHAVNILNSSASKQAAASISGLSLAEIRVISDRTGAGNNEPAHHVPHDHPSQGITVETISGYNSEKSFVIDADEVPAKTHDCWQQLIDEKIGLDNSPVALQMLLQKVRQQLAKNFSETNKIKAADVLRQYFVRNKNLHRVDIETLHGKRGSSTVINSATVATASGIPAPEAPIWIKIINGTMQIDTSDIALQMMIERVRQLTERNTTEGSSLAAIKILRQFFQKHLIRLGNEIEQIQDHADSIARTMHDEMTVIPNENHKCWQEIIDGELTIRTNLVGLQMMIERIRRAISRNNSATNRMTATKMLRQYFHKHRASASNELAQISAGTIRNKASVDLNVPPEAHPGWQKMINGEVQLSTDAVALKMMLQSIRLSVENNPGEATRTAAAKILRQYFVKHQGSHRTEIEQLIAA